MRLILFLLALGSLSFLSCKKDKILTPAEQLQVDIKIIEDYIAKNGLITQSTPSGLHYVITKAGFGNNPTINSTVKVQYKGYFTDGSVFDGTNPNEQATFPLTGVIEGWQECIPLLQKTGKGTFLIPSALAYGPAGRGSIPGNSVLIFDVQLDDFN